MTTQIKGLTFAAAVAMLAGACGTGNSPTGMDVATIEAGSGFSAQRREPLPPQAPEPQSPESVPVPSDPGSIPEVKPKPGADVPTAVPSNRPHRPSPVSDDVAVPAPGDDTVPVVNDDAAPSTVPPTRDPSEGPAAIPAPLPPTGGPAPTPLPPTVPSVVCRAVSMEIAPLVNAVDPDGDAFVATLLDKAGDAIEDMSCEKILWSAVGVDSPGRGIRITYGHLSRYVTVNGALGGYVLQAQAPNGVVASISFGGGRK